MNWLRVNTHSSREYFCARISLKDFEKKYLTALQYFNEWPTLPKCKAIVWFESRSTDRLMVCNYSRDRVYETDGTVFSWRMWTKTGRCSPYIGSPGWERNLLFPREIFKNNVTEQQDLEQNGTVIGNRNCNVLVASSFDFRATYPVVGITNAAFSYSCLCLSVCASRLDQISGTY